MLASAAASVIPTSNDVYIHTSPSSVSHLSSSSFLLPRSPRTFGGHSLGAA